MRLAKAHVQSRVRLVLAMAALALGVAGGASRLPERTEASVAEILGRGASGVVHPVDYVWERSGGTWNDLVLGRGVVFLARADGAGPRDAWRGRVSVTPFGRPLHGGAFVRLSDTRWGDERSLVLAGSRAAFSTWFAGKVQSISLVDLDVPGGAVAHHVLRAPAERVVFELGRDELVVAVGDPQAAAVVALGASDVRAEPLAELGIARGEISPNAVDPVGAFVVTQADRPADDGSAEGLEALVESTFQGGEPAIVGRTASGAHAWIVDTRQLEAAILPGRLRPHSDTGWVDTDGIPEGDCRARAVAAVGLPMSRSIGRSGFVRGQHWYGLIGERAPAIGAQAGAVRLGEWPYPPWQVPDVDAQWLGVDGGGGQLRVCVTDHGQLAIGWSDGGAKADELAIELPSHCQITVAGSARPPFFGIGAGVVDQWQSSEAAADPLLVFLRRPGGLSRIRLPGGSEWRAPGEGQGTPAWIPSMLEGSVMVLGVEVSVTHIDARRYDWAIMLGQREKSHRLKGRFPEQLPSAEAARAAVAVGLGTGKRRKPRGLRIGGSTGHPFDGKEGLLVVGAAGLELLGPERATLVPEGDGTELPLTVSAGVLVAGARERGARQPRADLCVLEDGGGVLLAESVFDSHEANADALIKLGCMRAAALDRGSDLPATRRSGRGAAEPQEGTALVALDKPLRGTAAGWDVRSPH